MTRSQDWSKHKSSCSPIFTIGCEACVLCGEKTHVPFWEQATPIGAILDTNCQQLGPKFGDPDVKKSASSALGRTNLRLEATGHLEDGTSAQVCQSTQVDRRARTSIVRLRSALVRAQWQECLGCSWMVAGPRANELRYLTTRVLTCLLTNPATISVQCCNSNSRSLTTSMTRHRSGSAIHTFCRANSPTVHYPCGIVIALCRGSLLHTRSHDSFLWS